MIVQLRLRRGTSDEWNSVNPVLASGEPGIDTTSDTMRVGDGITAWSELPVTGGSGFSGGGGGGTDLNTTDPEVVRDTMAATLLGTERIVVTPSDAGNTIMLSTPATVNSTDDFLISRFNHTGTQIAASISDLSETVQDIVGSLVTAGAGMTVTYNDTNGTLLLESTGGGGGGGATDPEVVRDAIGSALRASGLMQVTPDDTNDTITITTSATANSPDSTLLSRVFHTGTQLASTISDFATAVQAQVTNKLNLKNNANVNLSPTTDSALNYTIVDDGSATTNWPNRLAISYTPVGQASFLTGWFNEYGELRVNPGRDNTIPFRIFAASTPAKYLARSMTDAMFQIVSDRTNRTEKINMYADGKATFVGPVTVGSLITTGTVSGSNIAAKVRTVPAGTTGFATEPDGTLWIEYTP